MYDKKKAKEYNLTYRLKHKDKINQLKLKKYYENKVFAKQLRALRPSEQQKYFINKYKLKETDKNE